MNEGKYIFSQLNDFLPYYEFEKCIERYRGNLRVKKLRCWDQYLAMSFGQLTARSSLRDIVTCLGAHRDKTYHLGFRSEVARSTLADANERRDWRIYRDLAQVLTAKARRLYADDADFCFDLDHSCYALDSSTIDLCLSVFLWAPFRKTKAGLKLHTAIDLRGNIPTFLHVTDAKVHDVNALDELPLEVGAFYIMDRAYLDYARLYKMHQTPAFFIIRAKKNTKMKRLYSLPVDKSTGVRCDQIVRFSSAHGKKHYPDKLRRIKYYDAETDMAYVFLTNNMTVDAKIIADLYKCRWQIELFFKWVKQHLKIQVFWGQSSNAVHTQIWIAVCTYVSVAIIKKTLHIEQSLNEILQILSVSAFSKMPLQSLFQDIELQKQLPESPQAALGLDL